MKRSRPESDRRDFLKGSLLMSAAGAAAAAGPAAAQSADGRARGAPAPTEARLQAEFGKVDAADDPATQIRNPGSDFMVDLLKHAGIQYVAAMPGSTFRGLHESIVNYGGNQAPELITCVHEEISAAMAHGYAKVAGKPMACLVHSNVGLQHASMAIYNAWCDRAPMIVMAGNALDAATRRPWIEWLHTQTDLATIVRDFTKWDDTPVSLQHFAESFMRACEVTMTPPYEPVLLVVDSDLQEHPVPDEARPRLPRRGVVAPPAGDPAAIERAAALLAAADSPLIIADRLARTPEGIDRLVQLAELLNAPVVDCGSRLNMPTDHYLCHTFRQRDLVATADVILGLELTDIFGLLNAMPDLPVRSVRPIVSDKAAVIAISANYGYLKGNVQDAQRYFAADLMLDADGETCLPQLIEAVRRRLTPQRRRAIAAREADLRAAHRATRAAAAEEAALSWDASPIGTGRLCMELWDLVKDLDWALVSSAWLASQWPQRLWDINKHYQFIGDSGGAGIGYGAPAAAGAALAHRDAGRIPIAVQSDGDLLVLPGTLWTLAHHRIPLLMVMQNNRAWHQETMHLQRMTNRRNRGVERAPIGTLLTDPEVDFARMAQSMGVWAEGPMSDPETLRPALSRALDVVKSGKPALLDVITQPR